MWVLLALGALTLLPGCPFFTRADRGADTEGAAAPAAQPAGH